LDGCDTPPLASCPADGAHIVHAASALTFLTFDEKHHRIPLLELPGDELTTWYSGIGEMRHTFVRP
jgi:hypothetical protein